MKVTKRFELGEVQDNVFLNRYEDENGVKYFNFKELCRVVLEMDNIEVYNFRKIAFGMEELEKSFIFGKLPNGKGVHLIRELDTNLLVKKYYETELNRNKLNDEISKLLMEKDDIENKWTKRRRMTGKFEDIALNNIIYLRNHIPRISLNAISKIYGFDKKMIKSICRLEITEKGFPKSFYSSKNEDLTLEGFFLLQNVTCFNKEYAKDILMAFYTANNQIMTGFYQEILKNNELKGFGG